MITLTHVCVDFTTGGQRTRAVDDVTLQIPRGTIFGIVGTSGAGKSTLLRTLNALQRPSLAPKSPRFPARRCAPRASVSG